VALGADDVQTARGDDFLVARLPVRTRLLARGLVRLGRKRGELHVEIAAENDVGTAAGHVRRDRDGAGAARLRDDERLALVLLGVQHLVRDVLLLQYAREQL